MAFRRTAFSLIIITIITAICIAVLIWNHLKGGSSLILMVPKQALSFYQFKSRDIRAKLNQNIIPQKNYFDSLSNIIRKSVVFEKYNNPDEPGIDKYSDFVFFTTEKGKFMVLQLSDPSKFEAFVKAQPRQIAGSLGVRDRYNYLTLTGKNLYLAFKGKAFMIYKPDSTYNNIASVEETFNFLFNPKLENITTNPTVQSFNSENCDILYWQKNNPLAFGVKINENNTCKFVFAGKSEKGTSPSPLRFFQSAGINYTADDIDKILKPDNQISAADYLNQTFRLAYQHLKQLQ